MSKFQDTIQAQNPKSQFSHLDFGFDLTFELCHWDFIIVPKTPFINAYD